MKFSVSNGSRGNTERIRKAEEVVNWSHQVDFGDDGQPESWVFGCDRRMGDVVTVC